MSVADRLRIREVRLLSQDRYVLKKITFDWRHADGSWRTAGREVYDRGDGAALLAFDPVARRVLLTRQFRLPAFVNGHDDLMIEAPAGLLDDAAPEDRIRAEVEEETGYRLKDVRQAFDCFMSPGAVTERLHLFVAEYDPAMRVGDGGGLVEEGEDIEVLELPLDEALRMVADGRIVDAKTIILLQYAALNLDAVAQSAGAGAR